MARAKLAPLIGPEFDAFLAASIGDHADGRSLSVLSAYARSDLDPWQEAVSLAKMSREKAIARLTAFLAAIPDRPAADIPTRTVAARLAALLPNKGNMASETAPEMPHTPEPSKFNANLGFGFSAAAFLLVLALMAVAEPKAGSQVKGRPVASWETSAKPPVDPQPSSAANSSSPLARERGGTAP